MSSSAKRNVGVALVASGVIMVVLGIAALGGGDGGEDAAPTTTTTEAPPPSTTTLPPTISSTTSTTTTTTAPPTTTTATTAPTTTLAPTTTVDPATLLEAFAAAYAEATENDDVDFLYTTLHPVVIQVGGEDLCRSYVEDEIVLISGYELTGPVEGPVEVASGITGYTAGVVFQFEGQTFSDTAAFAIVDSEVRWLTTCR